PSSIAIAFVLPLVLLLLFGYGVSLDARNIPLAVVVEQADTNTASLLGSFQHSLYFQPQQFDNIQSAQQAFDRREVSGIVWLRHNFSERLLSRGDAPIGVIVNGVDANQARITSGYIQGVWQSWLASYAAAKGIEFRQPVTLEPRIWFNAAVRSRNFLVPGLIAVIMTLIGAMLTSMVVAREWERGTMEALLVTPIRIGELVVGKLFPYFILGMGGMLLSVAMALWQFDVPLRGSFWLLTLTSALFMLVALGMGLLISVVAKNQFVAGQVSIVITFLPAFILSGFIFQIGSMPEAIQIITHIIPARYYVAILQTLFLAGDIWPIILGNSAALVLMMVIFLGLARRKLYKRLDT
ncbi:MAG TPA: ABC transporter permease, partial [Gammaproteobacteria bacterium]|nr:ABC transporter permease [Gammaproteobacteria bacterium]